MMLETKGIAHYFQILQWILGSFAYHWFKFIFQGQSRERCLFLFSSLQDHVSWDDSPEYLLIHVPSSSYFSVWKQSRFQKQQQLGLPQTSLKSPNVLHVSRKTWFLIPSAHWSLSLTMYRATFAQVLEAVQIVVLPGNRQGDGLKASIQAYGL